MPLSPGKGAPPADSAKPVAARQHPVWVYCALAGLAACGWEAARAAWADQLSRGSLEGRILAARRFPAAPVYERLADKREEVGQDPLADLRHAVSLDPENPARRMRLGVRAELSGHLVEAEENLLRAAELDRGYRPRYLLAQFFFRRQDEARFERWSREAFQAASGDTMALIDLCWQVDADPGRVARRGLSEKPAVARQFLVSLALREQLDAARQLASSIAASARQEDLGPLLTYANLCLFHGYRDAPLEVWNRLSERKLVPYPPLDADRGPLAVNSDFSRQSIGTGFDWRVEPRPWVRSVRFGGGLFLDLSGEQPESCLLAWQYVPVIAGRHYRLSYASHAVDSPEPDGLAWVFHEVSGKIVPAGTAGDRGLRFTAPADLLRLAVYYRRPAGSVRMRGTVVIERLALEEER